MFRTFFLNFLTDIQVKLFDDRNLINNKKKRNKGIWKGILKC